MTQVLSVITPVYVAVLVGFLAVRSGYVPREAMGPIGAFVLRVALPALLFAAVATRPVVEVLHPVYLLAYGFGSLAAMGVAYALALRVGRAAVDARTRHLRASYLAMASGTSNSGYVGLPVLSNALPAYAAPVFGMNVLVENLLTIPLGMALAERAAGGHANRGALARQTAVRLATSPLITPIVLGLTVSALGIPLPEVVHESMTMFAQATTAPALFVIGGLLVGQSARGSAAVATPLLVGKLLAHPLAVAALIYPLAAAAPGLGLPALPGELRTAAIISAAAPTISILPVLAGRHGQQDALSSAAFWCTLGAALTLSAVLFVMHLAPGSGL